MVIDFIREIVGSSSMSSPFSAALGMLDDIDASSSLAPRRSLARLAIESPRLLQRNFRRHSVGELATSQTLEAVASTLKPGELRGQLLGHSQDEMRHSHMFDALARSWERQIGRSDEDDHQWILENDRYFVEHYNGDVIEFICDLFAGEVRTYSFVREYVHALTEKSAYAAKTRRILEGVLDDERRHIGYTARHINRWMAEGLDLGLSLRRSFEAFDRNSWIEVAETARFFYEKR